ncbi:CatB-related O-acetyltransferase [Paraconexibacter antarcticus]|uniref:CatB-related O-acetyltransferase n=1 Tax=Paraconexibacter antarcticus TaxID=2949664 RepID=UPI0026656CDE|nr:CatB-related O-acetyltransferase [Paraconexibacter antarcticus]
MIKYLRLIRYTLRTTSRSLRGAVLGADNAEMIRLRRKGLVITGHETYGIPTILTYDGGTERLLTGSYCSLGGTFLLGGKHAVDAVTTYPHRINWKLPGAYHDGFPTPTGDTVLGSDVWTCAGSLILSGVRIGDGAIVGAGALVTKDVPPYAIVGGNPARVLRYRYDEAQREALLAIRWWDWPIDAVREAVPLLAGKDVDAFIAYAHERMPQPNFAR